MLKSISNRQRLKVIKKCCGENLENELESIFNKAFSFVETGGSLFKIIEFFYLIDNFENLDIEKLQPYTIGSRKIRIVKNTNDLKIAVQQIQKNRIIGFDTEQRPTFKKGEPSNGVAIIQIANGLECYIFQVKSIGNITPLLNIFENEDIIKIGSCISGDNKELLSEFGIRVKSYLDLYQVFKHELYSENHIGAKKAVAIFLRKKMIKAKRVTLSNWEKKELTEHQVKYASEDAASVYDVFVYLLINYPFIANTLPKWFQTKVCEDYFYDEFNQGLRMR